MEQRHGYLNSADENALWVFERKITGSTCDRFYEGSEWRIMSHQEIDHIYKS
jgi:hypothetical protein